MLISPLFTSARDVETVVDTADKTVEHKSREEVRRCSHLRLWHAANVAAHAVDDLLGACVVTHRPGGRLP